MPKVDQDLDNVENLKNTQPEIYDLCSGAELLRSGLDPMSKSSTLEMQRQKLNDLDLAREKLSQFAKPMLTPKDREMLRAVPTAFKNTGDLDALGRLREAVQGNVSSLKASAAQRLPKNATDLQISRRIDQERRLETLQAVNEVLRAAETALGANGPALKHAAGLMADKIKSDSSLIAGKSGADLAARLDDLRQSVDSFDPATLGSLNKQETELLDNLRFSLCGISNLKQGAAFDEVQKSCEALEHAASTNSALAGPAKTAATADNVLKALYLQAAEARLNPASWLQMSSTPWMAKAQRKLDDTNSKTYLDTTEVYGTKWYAPNLEWCGAFVNWSLGESGAGNLPAKPTEVSDWQNFGKQAVQPVFGAVAILGPKDKPDHMGFVAGRSIDGRIVVLAGNQMKQQDSAFRGVTYYADARPRNSEFRIPENYEPKPADSELPLMVERNGSWVYATDELKEIRNLSPQEAVNRLTELLSKCQIDPVAMKADLVRIWIEAGGQGEPPGL